MKKDLRAGSLTGNKVILYPRTGKDGEGYAYVIEINDSDLLLDIYCNDVILNKINENECRIEFKDLIFNAPYKEIKNDLSSAMSACL